MPRAGKHPKARENARRLGLITMTMASPNGLHAITGGSPPTPAELAELAVAAAADLKIIVAKLNLAKAMLDATHALTLQQFLRLDYIAIELKSIAAAAEKHTALAARHEQRMLALEK
jgi:hypothetical protein